MCNNETKRKEEKEDHNTMYESEREQKGKVYWSMGVWGSACSGQEQLKMAIVVAEIINECSTDTYQYPTTTTCIIVITWTEP